MLSTSCTRLVHLYSATIAVYVITHRAGVQPRLQRSCGHGLWPVAIQLHVDLVCRFDGLHLCNTWITTHLLTLENGSQSWLPYSGQFTHKVITCQP